MLSLKLKRRLLRASVAMVLLTGLAEVGLRLLGLGNPLLQTADKDCYFLFKPNQQSTRFFCTNHINQYSMRSDDITAEKPAGTYRIMMVGDSVLYGTTYVDQSRIFATQIQHDLPAKLHEPVQVLNASSGGWATGNELAYLKSRGTFESDMVVFVLNTGDLEGPLNDKNQETLRKEGVTEKPLCALTELWSHYLSPRLFPAPAPRDAGSFGTGELVRPNIDLVLANIADAKKFANEHKAGFAILFSPALGGNWENDGYKFGYSRLQTFVADAHIPMVDLTPQYRQIPLDKLYESENIHLRPAGHDLVARVFVDAVPGLQTSIAQQLQPQPSLAAAP